MPSRGEDISQEDKIGLMLFSRWQLESIEVGVWDADVLSLPSYPSLLDAGLVCLVEQVWRSYLCTVP